MYPRSRGSCDHYYLSVAVTKAKRGERSLDKSYRMHRQWQTCRRRSRLALHSRSLFRS